MFLVQSKNPAQSITWQHVMGKESRAVMNPQNIIAQLSSSPQLRRAFQHFSVNCFGFMAHSVTVGSVSPLSLISFPASAGSFFQRKSSNKPTARYMPSTRQTRLAAAVAAEHLAATETDVFLKKLETNRSCRKCQKHGSKYMLMWLCACWMSQQAVCTEQLANTLAISVF